MIRHLPWIIWMGIIAVLSLIPGDQLPNYQFELISIDTLTHLCMYTVLAFLQGYGFWGGKNKMNFSKNKMYIVLILIGVGFGLIIELIQGNYIYRRYFDLYDIVANFFGTIFGIIIYTLIGIKFKKN